MHAYWSDLIRMHKLRFFSGHECIVRIKNRIGKYSRIGKSTKDQVKFIEYSL